MGNFIRRYLDLRQRRKTARKVYTALTLKHEDLEEQRRIQLSLLEQALAEDESYNNRRALREVKKEAKRSHKK